MKNYKIKKTKELIKKFKPFWSEFIKIENKYYGDMFDLQVEMSKSLKIKDLEIFFCDNEAVGVGNLDRTMELIRREELEGGK